MTLFQYLGINAPVTHKLHKVYLRWLDMQQDEPSRADYYSMQIAVEVRRVLEKLPRYKGTPRSKTKLEDMRLKSKPVQSIRALSVEEQSQITSSIWRSRLGVTNKE